jgi:cytoplasmic tRNA 2-thiolation protein 2
VVREEAEEQWIPSIPLASREDDIGRPRASICICRPLKDVGMKECAAWAWWSGLKMVGREKVPGAQQGIGGLTKGGHLFSYYTFHVFCSFSLDNLLP